MNNRNQVAIVLAIALSAMLSVTPLWAQEAKDAAKAEVVLPNRDVEALLETNPTTPAELIRASYLFDEFGRPDLGKKMLGRLMAAGPSEKELIELVESVGQDIFIDIARRKSLAPEGEQVANAALQAVNKKTHDPKRIDGLIGQLQDPSIDVRSRALGELSRAQGTAIGRMINVLSDPTRESEHANLWAALIQLGPGVVDPLIGVLDRSDPRLMTQAVRVLGQLKAVRATDYLLGPYTSPKSDPELRKAARRALLQIIGRLPSKKVAIEILTKRAGEYLGDRRLLKSDVDGNVDLWHWDEASKRCQAQRYTSHQANRVVAFRLARDAFALAPEDPKVKTLYLMAMLEAEVAQREAGAVAEVTEKKGDDSVLGRVTPFGVPVLEETLRRAMAEKHFNAAAEAARLLGRVGTAAELLYQGTEPAPLALAVRYPDPRVRAAALQAIMQLQPSRGYPGSSYVPQALTFFASTSGRGRVLIVGPRAESTRSFAATLGEVGYQVDTATSGREMIRKATASADYELAFVEMSIDDPSVKLLLRRLRGDYRTAGLRIGLVARAGQLKLAEQLAAKDTHAEHFSRAHSVEAFRWQLAQLDKLDPLRQVSGELRQRWAEVSLHQLAILNELSADVYNLNAARGAVLEALLVPKLAPAAIDFLKNDKYPASQRALMEVASRRSLAVEVRRKALSALRHNIDTNGILLTTVEIQRQYDRYNAAGGLDEATQHLLALVLDCLEAPTEKLRMKKEQ